MKAFYTLLILLIPFVGFGQLTYVPDDNFEQALIDLGYDDILDDYVQTNNINQILELDLPWWANISSLTGIEDFTQLTSLICRNNQITTLDLSNNSLLTFIDCSNNQITTLDLSNNSLLTFIDCSNNQITYISFNYNNNAVEELNCSRNNLSSLTIFQNYGSTPNNILKHLNIEDNLFENFNFTSYTGLEYLYIGKNKFKNIDLSSNVNLKQFSSYDVYSGDSPNEYFNQINSISFFNNSNIENIIITNSYLPDSNKVHSIILPYEAENLTSINLFNNLIECLDVSMYPNLQSISLGNNQLNQLNLQNGNQNLTPGINNNNLSCVEVTNLGIANSWNGVDSFTTFSLDCNTDYNCHPKTFVPDDNFEEFLESNGYGNGVENDDSVYTINISTLHNLIIISLEIYDLTGIEDFTNLINLNAFNNLISTIDLSNNINLEGLNLQSNQLSNLDLSNNINLENLNASNNQLNSLDLSNNSKLTLISIAYNQLLSLDLRNSNNQNLNGLTTLGNQLLTCINVDDENFSNINWTPSEDYHYFSNNCNWNCVNDACVDPLDGSGEYSSIEDCETNCLVIIEDSWNCVNDACVDPMDGSGEYSSIEDCETNCSVVIEDSWNCVNDACVDPMDGSGVYSSLNDCEANCSVVIEDSWNCVNDACVDPMDGSGVYSSLNDCEANCSVVIEDSWNCVNDACVDPMDGSGVYSSLNDCEANCTIVIEDSWNCLNDACVDPLDGSGLFSTLNDCEQECTDVSSINENLIDVNIYPNPSSNIFNIELNSDSETEIIVTNVLGEQVYFESTKSIGEFNTQIDLSNYSKGVYNLTIKTNTETSNHRLILQ
jgi:Leucine-rich repeat (LRR) protein